MVLYIIQYVHIYNEYFFAWLKRLITRQGATDSAGLPPKKNGNFVRKNTKKGPKYVWILCGG